MLAVLAEGFEVVMANSFRALIASKQVANLPSTKSSHVPPFRVIPDLVASVNGLST